MRLADYLETVGVDLLVSSPHTRAQQSIAPLAQRLGLAVEIEPRLAERVLSAAPLAQWREAIRQSFVDLDLAWPGGESSRTAMARGRAAIDALLARPQHVLVGVTHGNLMTLLLRSFAPQFGFETWECLSNPDVYCIAMLGEHIEVSRTWVPSLTAPGPSNRHSYATELHDRGADIRDIRDLLGHESVSATEIYTHVSTARQKKVVSLLEK